MDPESVLACQFGCWYSAFQHITFQSRMLDLPECVVEYLLQDGVHLPEGSRALPTRADEATAEIQHDWHDSEHSEQAQPSNMLPASFSQAIDDAIQDLGGRIVPKLNWSCPTDATWISSNSSLLCTNSDEVMVLLKSSDRAVHDISEAFDECASLPDSPPQLQLVLRRYVAMSPEREFRCFVHEHALTAICQRHIQECFPGLQQQKQEILQKIVDFQHDHLCEQFALTDYVFDVYINSKGNVRLVDFNPIGGTTNPLLFTWEELPFPLPKLQAAASQHSPGHTMSSTCSSAMSTGTRQSGSASLHATTSPVDALPSEPGQHVRTGPCMQVAEDGQTTCSHIRHDSDEQQHAHYDSQGSQGMHKDRASRRPNDDGTDALLPAGNGCSNLPSTSAQLPADGMQPAASRAATSPAFYGQLDLPQHLLPQAWDNCPVQPSARWSDLQPPDQQHQHQHQQRSLAGFSSDSEVDISDTLTPHVAFSDLCIGLRDSKTPVSQPIRASPSCHKISSSSLNETQDDSPPQQHGMRSVSSREEQEAAAVHPDGIVLPSGVLSWCSDGVELRLVVQPNSVYQNAPRGGIPYDMVDQSEGGPMDALLARLQAAELQS